MHIAWCVCPKRRIFARESEYSKATLYVYFQSKEEIINAIFLSGLVLLQR
ncbi:TetR family transcriptional regulator, partial [Pseudoflavonifractor phocaeensis]|nr:TetR family transcriptional regulator [Pseudoflavonifractor phocaeensis]